MSYLDEVARKRGEAAQKKQRDDELKKTLDTTKSSGDTVAKEIVRQNAKNRTTTQKVKVENDDLAKKGDIDAVIAQLKEVQLASLMSGSGNGKTSVILTDSTDLGDRISYLGEEICSAMEKMKADTGSKDLAKILTSQYKQLVTSFSKALSDQSKTLSTAISRVESTIESKEFNPSINVEAPVVQERQETEIDLSPVRESLDRVEKAVKSIKVEIPKTDYSDLEDAVRRVESAINNQVFPVPNYVLPFKDITGKATQVVLDADGKVPVAATATIDTTGLATSANQTSGAQKTQIVDAGGEAATVTGGKLDVNATASLAGTALPISGATEAVGVAIVDSSGNQISSFGGGTQYTEDAAAAANPVGTALNLVRDDARGGSLTTTDGDNVSARGTNAGELYVKHVDTIPATQSGTWNITNVSGTVSLPTGAATAALQTQPGVDIGDVTVNNASGVSAVNIQDGGNSITVDNGGTFAVQATLAAETTKVIGTVNQGTSPWVTSNATTSVVGNGAAATAQRVTLANDSTGIIATVGAVTAITNALPAGTNNIGDVDVLTVPADPFGANADAASATGSISAKLRFIASTGIPITGTVTVGSHAVTNAGTFAVQDATVATNTGNAATSLGVMDDWDNAASDGASVSGDVAHDTADAGEPVKIGFKAKSPDGTDPGSVAEDDRANGYSDLNSRQYVNTHHPRSLHKHLDGSTAYTDESLVADPGDGFQVIITNIVASTGAATALNFFLEEGSTKIFGPIYLEAVAGRGFASGPIHLPVTASTAVTLTSSASIAQSFDVDYFIQAV